LVGGAVIGERARGIDAIDDRERQAGVTHPPPGSQVCSLTVSPDAFTDVLICLSSPH